MATIEITKIDTKFKKKFNNSAIEVNICERSGYYQDFINAVKKMTGNITLVGDVREQKSQYLTKYKTYECEFICLLNDGNEVKGIIYSELRGNRFVDPYVGIYNSKEVWPILNENTYWPEGYRIGEYNGGGHDYQLRSFIA